MGAEVDRSGRAANRVPDLGFVGGHADMEMSNPIEIVRVFQQLAARAPRDFPDSSSKAHSLTHQRRRLDKVCVGVCSDMHEQL